MTQPKHDYEVVYQDWEFTAQPRAARNAPQCAAVNQRVEASVDLLGAQIGTNLRNARIHKRMSMRELADTVGTSVQLIERLERNQGLADPALMEALQKVLGVKLMP